MIFIQHCCARKHYPDHLIDAHDNAQICTILKTKFFPLQPSAGGAWTVCTKCTKRGWFSAQARRGSKRAQTGSGRGSYPSPFAACWVLKLMVERSGSAREVAPEARRLRLVGGVIYLCFVSGRYGRNDGAAGGTAPPEMTMRPGDYLVGSSNA